MHKVVAGNYGELAVPSSSIEYNYTVVVKDSLELRVGTSARFVLSGLYLIEHPFPLFLLGADVYCRGKKH